MEDRKNRDTRFKPGAKLETMQRYFGVNAVPNPVHYPKGFAYYQRMYKFLRALKKPPKSEIIDII